MLGSGTTGNTSAIAALQNEISQTSCVSFRMQTQTHQRVAEDVGIVAIGHGRDGRQCRLDQSKVWLVTGRMCVSHKNRQHKRHLLMRRVSSKRDER
jgi:hypothetical protein